MIVLGELLFRNRAHFNSRILIIVIMLIDVSVLSAVVYLANDLGLFLTPLYLFLIFLYSARLSDWSFLVVLICMLGFVVALEIGEYWQTHELLKTLAFYAVIIPAVSYFVYTVKKNETLVDPLTSLPNRTLFHNRLEQAIKTCKKSSKKAALLFMDLDGFKQVNDTLGHDIGDQLLQHVAARIKNSVRDSDMIARLGGDEFAIILCEVNDLNTPIHIAENIIKKFEEPYQVGEKLIDVGISVGISMCPDHADTMGDLIRFSDVAMYSAKKERSGYEIYSDKYYKSEIENLRLMADLRAAIRQDRLGIVYQPKINLDTGKVDSVEALIRWNHAEFGDIPPVKFIALAEGSTLINELTDWVVNTALRHCYEWEERGCCLNVSINVSARNLKNEKIMVQVLSAIEKNRLRPSRVTLEITETSLMTQSDMTIKNLIGLSMMGVSLSIDDFGTGHASLIYMQRLPVREIKIDRVFVSNVASNDRDTKIVQSIIHMAHDIDCRVVAEGVESREVLERLQEMGCDLAQGFWISKPISTDQVVDWWMKYES